MKFKIDENLPAEFAGLLQAAGYFFYRQDAKDAKKEEERVRDV